MYALNQSKGIHYHTVQNSTLQNKLLSNILTQSETWRQHTVFYIIEVITVKMRVKLADLKLIVFYDPVLHREDTN